MTLFAGNGSGSVRFLFFVLYLLVFPWGFSVLTRFCMFNAIFAAVNFSVLWGFTAQLPCVLPFCLWLRSTDADCLPDRLPYTVHELSIEFDKRIWYYELTTYMSTTQTMCSTLAHPLWEVIRSRSFFLRGTSAHRLIELPQIVFWGVFFARPFRCPIMYNPEV